MDTVEKNRIMLDIVNMSVKEQLDLIYNHPETLRKLSSQGNIVVNDCEIFDVFPFKLQEYLALHHRK